MTRVYNNLKRNMWWVIVLAIVILKFFKKALKNKIFIKKMS